MGKEFKDKIKFHGDSILVETYLKGVLSTSWVLEFKGKVAENEVNNNNISSTKIELWEHSYDINGSQAKMLHDEVLRMLTFNLPFVEIYNKLREIRNKIFPLLKDIHEIFETTIHLKH
ncbi:MAG: hypothetical protein GXP63_01005 [DPANN group archaeon]|nr:hypothetical protein [DPANN group archaeon]